MVLDAAWQGSPGAAEIEKKLAARLERSGWRSDRFAVVVIDPELEVWLWSDPRALQAAIPNEVDGKLRQNLDQHIAEFARSVLDPKERLENLRRSLKIPASAAQFRRFAERARIDRCADLAFGRVRDALRCWFPP